MGISAKLTSVPATSMVSGVKGPIENVTATVLLSFSVRELEAQKAFMQLPYTCVA